MAYNSMNESIRDIYGGVIGVDDSIELTKLKAIGNLVPNVHGVNIKVQQ